MTTQKFIQFTGIALSAAGIFLLVWWIGLGMLMPLEGMETGYLNLVKDSDWLWVNIVGLIATILLPLGFVGLHLKQIEVSGNLGLIGFLCAFIGSLLFLCIQFIETVLWPIFPEHAPKLLEHKGAMFTDPMFKIFYLVMGIMLALGFILLGISTIISKVLPRWGAILLLTGGTIFSLVISVVMVRTIGIILLAAGLIWLGNGIWRKK
jgi:hypothetical protein